MRHGSYRNGSAALIASTREPGGGAGAHHCCDYKQTFHLHDLTDETILALFGCGFLRRFWPRDQAAVVAGNSSSADELLAPEKLRQCSKGRLAIVINASWLIMKPSNHGNAFCINP